jgi:hypothetical protein
VSSAHFAATLSSWYCAFFKVMLFTTDFTPFTFFASFSARDRWLDRSAVPERT